MSRQYTDQDRIDEQTMRIENPNVVGSGYIQFPPQRPFEKPVQVQPPTVAHLDYPHEYQSYSGATPTPQAAAQQQEPKPAVHGPQISSNSGLPEAARLNGTSLPAPHYATQPTQPSARPAVPQTQRQQPGPTYQTGAPGAHAAAVAPRPQQPQQQQQRAQQQYVPAQLGPRPTYPQPQSTQSSQPRQIPAANGYHIPAPQSRPIAVSAPAVAAKALPSASDAPQVTRHKPDELTDGGIDISQLTKAQKQRLRKKLREGRA